MTTVESRIFFHNRKVFTLKVFKEKRPSKTIEFHNNAL
jgi:hypothetical protein